MKAQRAVVERQPLTSLGLRRIGVSPLLVERQPLTSLGLRRIGVSPLLVERRAFSRALFIHTGTVHESVCANEAECADGRNNSAVPGPLRLRWTPGILASGAVPSHPAP